MFTVKIFRMIRRKSQFEISLETGIPSYRISSIENGRVEATPRELERIAEALETTPEVLAKEISEETLAASGAT